MPNVVNMVGWLAKEHVVSNHPEQVGMFHQTLALQRPAYTRLDQQVWVPRALACPYFYTHSTQHTHHARNTLHTLNTHSTHVPHTHRP